MNWSMRAPQAGDILRVDLQNGIIHYGIYVSDDEVIAFGRPPVGRILASAKDVKVLSTNIDEFLCGHFLEVATLSRAEKKEAREREEIIKIARSRLGEGGYHIIHNNCEHFVNECVFGVKRSSSMEAVRSMWQQRFEKEKN